ncbi:hypothetical protein [Streptomyces specialis]|uniref:hypothetical protein n=1 Tax=Streptomyces specialis TaxID=498367 RepID=UPI00073ED795|nr:hypothetical protein [Streptomyces specialis]
MSATERTAHRPEPANLDQPQLSVVAIFVTGPGTVRRAGRAPRHEQPPPPPQAAWTAWTAEQEEEYKAILTQVRDRFTPPVRNPLAARDARTGLLPLTAA